MVEKVLGLVVNCQSVGEFWECMEEHFLASTKYKEMQLKNQLAVKKGNQSLEEFIRKIKLLCDSLAVIQKPMEDVDKVFQLSKCIGSKYQVYNLAIILKPPYQSFNQYVAGIQGLEQQLTLQDEKEKRKSNKLHACLYCSKRKRRVADTISTHEEEVLSKHET